MVSSDHHSNIRTRRASYQIFHIPQNITRLPRGHLPYKIDRHNSFDNVGIFPGSSHTSNLKIGTPVATLSGAWRCRVSAGTGWPGVSILRLSEMESLVCNFYLSVAACKIV